MAERTLLKNGEKVLNGRYEILKVIHSRGMSNVYLVMDSNLNKQWCLKEIKKSEAGKNQIEYFSLLQEANIMKGLNHSNIPRITTIEEDGDSIFIIMDYIDGISLKSYILKNGRVSQDVAVNWMLQVAQVMSYLHNRKKPIFYRDMKPDNIMIKSNGDISLIDFGISLVLEEKGQVIDKPLGTKGYAAPEQSKKGMVCDLRSDIYALGKTMYYMLTGINPAQVPKEKLVSVKELVPTLSTGIELIVNKCVQEDVNKRYQSCEELVYDLQNFEIYDEKHIKGIKRKIGISLGTLGLSIALLGFSFIPLNLHKQQEDDVYNNLVMVAEQSGKSEDYEKVFNARPDSSISLYINYIDSLKVDGLFSKEEEKALLNYINPNLEILQDKLDYGTLSYEIGKLYWFFYESENESDGISSSVKWFKDASNYGYEPELSEVYYQLGLFNRDILSSIAESEDNGMYLNYWGNLLKAKEVDTGELVTLQINLCIARAIENYGYNLKSEGVSKDDMMKQVNDLTNFISNYTPKGEASQEKYNKLKVSTEGLSTKVSSLYSQGGEE